MTIVGFLLTRFGLLVAVAISAGNVADRQTVDVSTTAIVAAASRYVQDYESKFKFVIADETYTQVLYDESRQPTATRRMTGELFLTFLQGDEAWIAVHDFKEVDGVPVPGREDLRALLQKGETASIVRDVLARNARFNLGRITRNFNEPTFALLVLEPARVKRFAFNREEVLTTGDTTRVRLSFQERDRPTLIGNDRGKPVYARGELTIDASTGRIDHSVIELVDGKMSARLTTTYAADEKLEMWVPVKFAERYERTNDDHELIQCEAFYTNYRRFETTARIK